LPARPPLRTVRASFPVSSSSPREAACNCAAGSLSFKRTYASITVVVSRKSAEVADTVSGAISCAPSMNSDYDSASEDRAEVCSASREVMLQPLSAPLQYSLRFLHLLIPARPTASLALRLPRGQSYGLTTFPFRHTTGSGLAFSPVDISTTCPDLAAEQPSTHLLVNAYQQLWHLTHDDVYQRFTYVTHGG